MLKGTIVCLQNKLQTVIRLPASDISSRNEQLLKFENETLRDELYQQRQFSNCFRSFLFSLDKESIKNDFVLTRTHVVNRAVQELLEIWYASAHDPNWTVLNQEKIL